MARFSIITFGLPDELARSERIGECCARPGTWRPTGSTTPIWCWLKHLQHPARKAEQKLRSESVASRF